MKPHVLAKHIFIPHEGNDYKPHFFRELSVGFIIFLIIFLLGFSAGSSFFIHRTVLGANVTASVLIDLTNESRIAYNEEPLARNPLLDQAAQLKAEDMVKEGYFAHNSPKGVAPWHWFKQAGYVFLYAGENLAINFTDAGEVRDAWLKSPLHRANLLDVRFKEIGMATISGEYKDGPTIYVVQLFGTPAVSAAVKKTATEPAEATTTVVLASTGTSTAGTPQIKGEATESLPYQPIVTTDELAVVKNTEVEEAPPSSQVETYSPWYGKLLFGGSYYVSLAYLLLLGLIIIALLLMVFVEIRRQHWKHISYGLGLLFLLTLAILVNQVFW